MMPSGPAGPEGMDQTVKRRDWRAVASNRLAFHQGGARNE
jgi:hypothetical protein